MAWDDFISCFDTIESCHLNFTDEDRARRAALKEEADRIITKGERPERLTLSGKRVGTVGGPQESEESGAAMMETFACRRSQGETEVADWSSRKEKNASKRTSKY